MVGAIENYIFIHSYIFWFSPSGGDIKQEKEHQSCTTAGMLIIIFATKELAILSF